MNRTGLFFLLLFLKTTDSSEWRHSLRNVTQRGEYRDLRADTRLRHEWVLDQKWRGLDFALEWSLKTSSLASPAGGFRLPASGSSNAFELHHLSLNPIDEAGTRLDLRLERFSYNFSHQDYDFTIGRQPLTLGRGRWFSILDVINPFAPGALDTTYKPGIDALTISRSFSPTEDLQLIAAASPKNDEGAWLLRYRQLIQSLDLEWIAGTFYNRRLVGVGYEGEIGHQAIFGELALFEVLPQKDLLNSGDSTAFSGSLGLEWLVGPMEFFSISYFYQDFGAKSPQDLPKAWLSAPISQNWSFLGMRSYLHLGHSKTLDLKRSISLNAMLNLEDQSAILQPRLTWILNQKTDLTLWAFHGIGEDGLQSEFGSSGTGIGLFLKIYF